MCEKSTTLAREASHQRAPINAYTYIFATEPKLVLCLAQRRIEPANNQARERRSHAVHDARAIAHQLFPLAVWPFGVFFVDCRNGRHVAMALLSAQPAKESAHQQFRVEAVSLRTSVLTRHGDARWMHDIGFGPLRRASDAKAAIAHPHQAPASSKGVVRRPAAFPRQANSIDSSRLQRWLCYPGRTIIRLRHGLSPTIYKEAPKSATPSPPAHSILITRLRFQQFRDRSFWGHASSCKISEARTPGALVVQSRQPQRNCRSLDWSRRRGQLNEQGN